MGSDTDLHLTHHQLFAFLSNRLMLKSSIKSIMNDYPDALKEVKVLMVEEELYEVITAFGGGDKSMVIDSTFDLWLTSHQHGHKPVFIQKQEEYFAHSLFDICKIARIEFAEICQYYTDEI